MVRVPLLPVSGIEQFFDITDSVGLHGMAIATLQDEVAASALWLSNPGFYERATAQLKKSGRLDTDAVRTVLMFALRMHSRATPFGLMASVSYAPIGPQVASVDISQCRQWTRSRPDSRYLARLSQTLAKRLVASATVVWRVNPTLYVVGSVARYYAQFSEGSKRVFKLVEAELDEALDATFRACEEPSGYSQIVSDLVGRTSSSEAEISQFVGQLIEHQILVSNVEAPVTTPVPLSWLSRFRESGAADTSVSLPISSLVEAFETHDSTKIADKRVSGAEVLRVMRSAEPTLAEAEYAIQSDLYRDIKGTVVPSSVANAVAEIASRLGPGTHIQLDWLARFISRFQRKFEDQEIPLLLAVDPDFGVDIAASDRGVGWSLLDGISTEHFQPHSSNANRRHSTLPTAALAGHGDANGEVLLADAWRSGQSLSERLPVSFAAMVRVVTCGPELQMPGNMLIFCDAFRGPSATAVFGRFCHPADELMHHVAAQADLDSGSCTQEEVLAEVCHLPQDRAGNLMFRPRLHSTEIDCLGTTIASPTDVLPLSDLMLSVQHGKIRLRSKKLDKFIQPRITSAFTFWINANLPVYRLLGLMQYQNGIPPHFSWATEQTDATFLPRVRWKNVVLSPKRWRFSARQIESMRQLSAPAFLSKLNEFWHQSAMDEWVYFVPDESEDRRIPCRKNAVASGLILQKLMQREGARWHFEEAPELTYSNWLGRNSEAYCSELVIPLRTAQRRA